MVKCVRTTNGIAGGPVCQGDVTLQLTAGGMINSSTGFGLQANNTATSPGTAGLYGKQGNGIGFGPATPVGIWGDASAFGADQGTGVFGSGVIGVSTFGVNIGVVGGGGGTGVLGSGDIVGVMGMTGGTRASIVGVSGSGPVGVQGEGEDGGVLGNSTFNPGVAGQSTSGAGVSGMSTSGPGVFSSTDSGSGVYSLSKSGTGVFAFGQGVSPGVAGISGSGAGVLGIGGSGLAGEFFGDVDVSGSVTKTGGGFKIDHPLDPANKYLSHSFVESPDRKNVYDGVVVLAANGETEVELPEWFEALNQDFRYQLTAIGAPAPNLYIAQKITNSRFRIAGGSQGLEVSWQVTGIRKDFWAQAHPLMVEAEKPNNERDHYLHPEVHGQPAEKSIAWTRHPEVMRQLLEAQNQPTGMESPHRAKLNEIRQRLREYRRNLPGKTDLLHGGPSRGNPST